MEIFFPGKNYPDAENRAQFQDDIITITKTIMIHRTCESEASKRSYL